jgi:hypothetical protein
VELLFAGATPRPSLVDVLDELETLIEDVGSGWVGPALAVPEGLSVFVDLPDAIEDELREPIISALSDALGAEPVDGSGLPRVDPAATVVPGDDDRDRLESSYPDGRVLSEETGFEEPADVADELADVWDRNPDRQLRFLRDCLVLEGPGVYAEIVEEAFADRPGLVGFCHQWARATPGLRDQRVTAPSR